MALHLFGKPVSNFIDQKMDGIVELTLIVINLFGADPLDYEFINIAFSRIIEKYQKDKNIFIAFKAGNWEREELFTGITKILRLKKKYDQSDKDILIENGINLIIVNDKNETIYVTNLDKMYIDVLKKIENNEKTSSLQLQKIFNLNAEDTSRILSKLLNSKFIYETDGPFYHAIISLIL